MTVSQVNPPSLEVFQEQAMQALACWGLPEQTPRLLNYRENAVFEVRDNAGNRKVLRLHRPGYHTQVSLESELQWMAYLKGCGLAVPASVSSVNGDLVIRLKTRDGDLPQFADMIGWVEGHQFGHGGVPLPYCAEELETLYRDMGRTIARMHCMTDVWQKPEGFDRPAWNLDGFLGERPIWGRFWDCAGLSSDEAKALTEARIVLRERLNAIAPRLSCGLIHADLVRENVFRTGTGLAIIDFNDCGPGFHLYELAVPLLQSAFETHYPVIRSALIAGYLDVRPQMEEDLPYLDLFLLLRSLAYIGWAGDRVEIAGGPALFRRFIHRGLERIALTL